MAEKPTELNIALNHAKRAGRKYAAKRAIRMVKLDVKKHFRVPFESIRLAKEVNEEIWKNGSYNLPTKLTLDILKEKESTRVFLKSGKEKAAFLAKQKKEKEKAKKPEKPREKETPAEKKAEIQEKEEQEKKLEEKRLKESTAQKAEFK